MEAATKTGSSAMLCGEEEYINPSFTRTKFQLMRNRELKLKMTVNGSMNLKKFLQARDKTEIRMLNNFAGRLSVNGSLIQVSRTGITVRT